ncbi:hypothetical protein J4N45_10405 [Vibrio sp. SCSIO 43140]|uniref:hypothetical protein n=1 Tax=Vibrio sp. SCSIO 43140 TaxID=2819100 RepID=UPI002075C38A|nr:hypothetical protein [Vibrio sp. SCSIO 43140]USD58941.1 hypothetical protein J4N45_10405 [Vibrio sp. SCSIO 43140]
MNTVIVRPLTEAEIKRFEKAEAQEKNIAQTYGPYSEHDSIREGMWIMKTGQFGHSHFD